MPSKSDKNNSGMMDGSDTRGHERYELMNLHDDPNAQDRAPENQPPDVYHPAKEERSRDHKAKMQKKANTLDRIRSFVKRRAAAH